MATTLTDNQRALVDALRSGNYVQGTGRLKRLLSEYDSTDAEYCCLGVATEISGLCVESRNHTDSERVIGFVTAGDPGSSPSLTYPTVEVTDWLGASEYHTDVLLDIPDEIAHMSIQGYTPGKIEEYFGDRQDLYDPGPISQLGLALLNDEGFTFNQIADCIEYFGIVSEQG